VGDVIAARDTTAASVESLHRVERFLTIETFAMLSAECAALTHA